MNDNQPQGGSIEGLPYPREVFEQGKVVFKEGDASQDAYFLVSGKVDLTVTIEGEEKPVGTVEAGGIFGELAMLAGGTRMVKATVSEQSEIITITPDRLVTAIEGSSPLVRSLLRVMMNTILTLTQARAVDAQEPPQDQDQDKQD